MTAHQYVLFIINACSLQLQEKKDKCLRLKSLLESIKTDPAGILSLNPHSLQITRPEDQAPPPVNHAVALPSPTGTKQTAPAGQSSPTQKSSLPIPAPNSEPIQINTSRPVQHENKFNPSHKLFLHQLLLERRPISQSMLEDAKYAVMTNDWMIAGRERQTFAFLQEFETAKKKELCLSSYQPKRAKEPSRSKFAWDYVLDEMV